MLRRMMKTISFAMVAIALTLAFVPAHALAESIDTTENSAVETPEDPQTPEDEEPVHESGWACEDDVFCYYSDEGEKLTNEWLNEDGLWYYFDADGTSVADTWVKSGGYWYYIGSDRTAVSDEWVRYNGSWYYIKPNGTLLLKGWTTYDGAWYYFGSNGKLVYSSWVYYNGKYYYLDANGNPLVSQRVYYKGTYYYFGSQGYCLGSSTSSAYGSYRSVYNACRVTPTTGAGGCASWVTAVFKRAGLGTWNGSARDMYNMWCTSSDYSKLQPGMIIAVPSTGGTYAAMLYGHVGIYLGNGIVMHNLKGVVGTMTLSRWISYCGGYATPRWGWLGGVVLF